LSARAFNLIYDVWKRVKPYIKLYIRECGRYRVPRLVVVYDVEVYSGKRVVAYYDPHKNEVAISAKFIDELIETAKFSERDVVCAIVDYIFHELEHYCGSDEEEAENTGLVYRALCYADLIQL
jgi:predicted MPP superfamily phosphohydrolase